MNNYSNEQLFSVSPPEVNTNLYDFEVVNMSSQESLF